MRRRGFVRMAAAGAAWVVLGGHTPYRQWQVYRQKHLLIGSCRADPPSYTLAREIVQTLEMWLPESSPRASRAPDQRRLASLLSSGQLQVTVMRHRDVADMAAGRAMFEATGPVPSRRLFSLGEHLLVCRPDFPDHHAWLVAATLSDHGELLSVGAPARPELGPVPVHPGALAHAAGQPYPAAAGDPAAAPQPDGG